MRRIQIVALVLAVTATVYVASTKDASSPPPQSLSPPTPIGEPMLTGANAPVSSAAEVAESSPPERLSNEGRVSAIKQAMAKSMAESRDAFASELVAQGLAQADSEPIAQRMIEGIADCLFEAARQQYEAQGIDLRDFLDWAEILWSQPVEASATPSRVAAAAAPCVDNASQQAGISLPTGFESPGSDIAARFSAGLESPPWAGDMEARIRDHIAAHSAVPPTRLLVKCRDSGCNAMLVGRDIQIFALQFDLFAEQNGFKHAILGGDSYRFVWLER
jgi:hypothetical protein